MLTSIGSRYVPGLVALGALLGVHGISHAHFELQSPPSSTEQNALGDPQKAPPCGDNGTAVATGIVTSIQAGDTITVTINETIFHPGHYRIALALDDGVFPDEPPVTPGTTDCGSAPIDPAPAFPVLADGVWEHAAPFGEPQSIDITIPEGVECTNCTLQVIQFMSNHGLNDPGGCYYHHCATLEVAADPAGTSTSGGDGTGGASSDDGTPPPATTADGTEGTVETTGGMGDETGNADAGATTVAETDPGQTPDDTASGCSCSLPTRGTGREHAGMLFGLFGLLGLATLRRRPRSKRSA